MAWDTELAEKAAAEFAAGITADMTVGEMMERLNKIVPVAGYKHPMRALREKLTMTKKKAKDAPAKKSTSKRPNRAK